MPEHWRVGRKVPRNLYRVTPEHPEGEDIGRMDTAEDAALVVEAVNHRLAGESRWEYGVHGCWPDGGTDLDWRRSREAAERVLAARAEIPGNVVASRLVRRLITTGPVEEVSHDG